MLIKDFIFHHVSIYGDGAKTHLLLPGIQDIVCNELYLYLIQCLCTIAVRPPQLRIFYGKGSLYMIAAKITGKSGQILCRCRIGQRIHCAAFCGQNGFSIRGSNGHYDLYFTVGYTRHPLDFSICGQADEVNHISMNGFSSYMMLLSYKYLCQTGSFYCENRSLTEQSCIWKTRTPVPAVHAGCFTNMRESRHCIGCCSNRAFCFFFCDEFCRGMQNHFYLIYGIGCITCNKIGNIILPDTVHVVCGADFLSVQINICDGINSVEV